MPALPTPTLMLVTDRHVVPAGHLPERVAAAVRGGVNVVQLREKDLPVGDLLALGRDIKAAINGQALFLVNDRVDVALALGADGVHLPQEGVPAAVARQILGPGALIGRSVHNEDTARDAAAEGVDYLILGPVYETTSHPGVQPPGLDFLRYIFEGLPPLEDEGPMEPEGIRREVAEVGRTPIIGIGGITPRNAPDIMAAGAVGVAAISHILKAHDPEQAARELAAAVGLPR